MKDQLQQKTLRELMPDLSNDEVTEAERQLKNIYNDRIAKI